MGPERLQATVMAAICALPPILMSVLIITQSWLVVKGRLQRNQYLGIRTPSTMRSDQAWVAGHRAALELAPLYLVTTAATCVALFAVALHAWRTIVVLIGIGGFAAIIALSIYTAVVASRAARLVDGHLDDRQQQ